MTGPRHRILGRALFLAQRAAQALVAGLGAAAMLFGPAIPARAAENGLVVEMSGPAANLVSGNPTVRGTVRASSGGLNLTTPQVDSIAMEVVTVPGDVVVASTRQTPGRQVPVDFTWTPVIPVNGNFKVRALASGKATLGLAAVSGDATRNFSLSVPPKPPQQVTASVNGDGTVVISWARNTEADILGYKIFRSDPGSDALFQIGAPEGFAHTACKARCELTDPSVAAIGGQYTYKVLAFRVGPTAPLASAASTPASATVPLPTTTTGPTEPGAPAGGPGTTAGAPKPAVGSARGPAISSFLANQPPPKPPPPPRILEPPDTGFARDLPFGALPESELEDPGPAEAVPPLDTLPVGSDLDEVSQGSPLVPVAAGLLLLMVAAHMRVFINRTRPGSDKPPPIELRQSSPLVAANGAGPSMRQPTVRVVAPDSMPFVFARAPSRERPPSAAGRDLYGDDDVDAEALAIDQAVNRGRRRSSDEATRRQTRDDRIRFDERARFDETGQFDEIEVALLSPSPRQPEPVSVGASRRNAWPEEALWDVVTPER